VLLCNTLELVPEKQALVKSGPQELNLAKRTRKPRKMLHQNALAAKTSHSGSIL